MTAMLTPRTRVLGVIGWPIEHSLSPRMQGAGIAALGLDWAYGAFPVEPEHLASAIRGAGALGFVGLNVTVPHKNGALALCRADELGVRVGAVNTLVFDEHDRGAPPRGTNTDVHGFRMLLDEAGAQVAGQRVAVLGAGGAARAVITALRDAGAEVVVVSRRPRTLALADGDPPQRAWSRDTFAQLLPLVAALVDTTPRGLDPASHDAHAPDLALLDARAHVIDIVVAPSTPLVAAARARGLRAVTGDAMLLHQGALALEKWTGKPAPIEAMRAALLDGLRSW